MPSALFCVHDLDGRHRGPISRLLTDWGSPDYQIPHLAEFYLWANAERQPLTAGSFLSFTASQRGGLPFQPVPHGHSIIPATDHTYRLTLSDTHRALRLAVTSRRQPPVLHGHVTQANLFTVAAGMCERLAERNQRYADVHEGFVVPGGEPHRWLARAAGYLDSHRRLGAADEATLAARYLPPTFDTPYPAVQVAGAYVFAYVHRDGHLQVSVDLDETTPWLLRGDGTVPTRISIQGEDVFTG
ncbi:hypothetical protein [Asanoa iriomotensis]|uniref:Uncharacterized protein n=1 Tax=Asanoa iriomotensis TaxID=234613 RepID=A0ABQ4C927_9ACTN|nr:hypothetical protein [Asanoa iriomotensis]GIF59285.1 hypothetical protein Air01nite_53800 [Asanoa iriomotensis]